VELVAPVLEPVVVEVTLPLQAAMHMTAAVVKSAVPGERKDDTHLDRDMRALEQLVSNRP
jgi:hypothetical protein